MQQYLHCGGVHEVTINMNMKLVFLLLSFIFLTGPAFADSICADRPGSGNSTCTVDSKRFQIEMGNDQQELRIGLIPKSEIDVSNSTIGIKYEAVNSSKILLSVRPSVDFTTGYITVEFPFQYNLNDKTNITIDPQFIQHDKTIISVDINRNITPSITITPELEIQGKPFINGYVSWIPSHYQSWQFDVGMNKRKVILGVSKKF